MKTTKQDNWSPGLDLNNGPSKKQIEFSPVEQEVWSLLLKKVTAAPLLKANEMRRCDDLKFWAILLHETCNSLHIPDVTNNTGLQQSLASNVCYVVGTTIKTESLPS
jgi:hypothetical protein